MRPEEVDRNAAMFPQVGKLGAHYQEWLDVPDMGTFRMFKYTLFETFAATKWWVIPLVWGPIILVLAALASGVVTGGDVCQAGNDAQPNQICVSMLGSSTSTAAPSWLVSALNTLSPPSFDNHVNVAAAAARDTNTSAIMSEHHVTTGESTRIGLSRKTFAVMTVAGLILWTLLEYILHRCLFHTLISDKSPFLIKTHFILHGQHHKFPRDPGRLVFPPVAGLMMATPFYIVFRLSFSSAFVANAVMAGALVGYVWYDLTHYYIHHGKPTGGYMRRLKEHHRIHHYKDHDRGFGISSEFWDHIFGTTHASSQPKAKTN